MCITKKELGSFSNTALVENYGRAITLQVKHNGKGPFGGPKDIELLKKEVLKRMKKK